MIKKIVTLSLMVLVCMVFARSDFLPIDLSKVTSGEQGKQKLRGVHFFMKGATHPEVAVNMGDVHSSKKTRSFGRGDEEACEVALLSTLIAIEKKAKSVGADAVIDIESYSRDKVSADSTKLECNVGSTVANMAVRGTMVRLKK